MLNCGGKFLSSTPWKLHNPTNFPSDTWNNPLTFVHFFYEKHTTHPREHISTFYRPRGSHSWILSKWEWHHALIGEHFRVFSRIWQCCKYLNLHDNGSKEDEFGSINQKLGSLWVKIWNCISFRNDTRTVNEQVPTLSAEVETGICRQPSQSTGYSCAPNRLIDTLAALLVA
jgi:hypothetical protein